MIRKAFRMSVNADQHAEYRQRHQPIWKELEQTLLAHGVHSYSIFLDPTTSDLFAYVEIECEERWNAIAETPICRQWWRSMSPIMPSHSDHRPISRELNEVFHLTSDITTSSSQ